MPRRRRRNWLRRCSECGRKYKVREPEGFERPKVRFDANGCVIPLCSIITCSGPQHLRDAVTIAKAERALMGTGDRE